MPPEQNGADPAPVSPTSKWQRPLGPVFSALLLILFLCLVLLYVTKCQDKLSEIWADGPEATTSYLPPRPHNTPVAVVTGEVDMTGWKTYNNSQVEFKHPSTWTVRETRTQDAFAHSTLAAFDPRYGDPTMMYSADAPASYWPSTHSIVVLINSGSCQAYDWRLDRSTDGSGNNDPVWSRGVCLLADGARVQLNAKDEPTKVAADQILSTFRFLPTTN